MVTLAIVYVTKRCRLEPRRNIVFKERLLDGEGWVFNKFSGL